METVLRSLDPSPRSRSSGRHKPNLGGLEVYGADRENTPPLHPNVQIQTSPSIKRKQQEQDQIPPPLIGDEDAKESLEATLPSSQLDPSDLSSVKVVVRVRPSSGLQQGDDALRFSSDSLSAGDRRYTFDSILGPNSTQEDVFRSVGIPLVKNCLTGFNVSIISYGQTGSGKTYTMWGPPSAMIDNGPMSSNQGIVPRAFHMLFSEIDRIQDSLGEKHINYQCRCSFLEVHNERVNNLLDPTQKDLGQRGDGRNGFNIENLSDEYVATAEDAIQLLIKGLANRKVGSSSSNTRSSRSHIIFTCIVESWCKGSTSECFSSSRSSKITFIDFAGVDKDVIDGVAKQHAEEARYIKQSLSKLGRLVNILGETSINGEDIINPYMGCCLTQLLQDVLGGNSKLTVLCTISPDYSSQASTISTLTFGERAKKLQNKAVINEISEDDVNCLSDQIRQLKEELIRAKLEEGNPIAKSGLFGGSNARQSLNFLRVSLNRSLILPHIDLDSEEEVEIDEEDVKDLCDQIDNLNVTSEDQPNETSIACSPKVDLKVLETRMLGENSVISPKTLVDEDNDAKTEQSYSKERSCISIDPIPQSSLLQDPTLCSSPKLSPIMRKSDFSPNSLAGQDCCDERLKSNSYMASPRQTSELRSSLLHSKVNPTESLAASIQRGLQIINYNEINATARRSSISLSFEHLATLSRNSARKVDAGMEPSNGDKSSDLFLHSPGKTATDVDRCKDLNASTNMQIVPLGSTGIMSSKVIKDDDIVLTNFSKREMELEALCKEQADTIKRLTDLVNQQKEEKHQGSDKEQISVDTYMINCSQSSAIPEKSSFDMTEKETLLLEIQKLKDELKTYKEAAEIGSFIQTRGGSCKEEEFEREKEKWLESESRWICLTEELRVDLSSNRRLAEKKEMELDQEKKCKEELDDALQRSIVGHARIIEHFVDLQEKYDDLLQRYRKVMEGIAEVKKAITKAGGKGRGTDFAAALAAELSTLRIDREKERAYLKEQNRRLKIQLRDTAEAVQAAGELLVRLREAEEAAFVSKEDCKKAEQERDEKTKEMDKLKKKHLMELSTLKHLLVESRLPESALDPVFRKELESVDDDKRQKSSDDDDQSWRAYLFISRESIIF